MGIEVFRPNLPKLDSIKPYISRIDASSRYSNFGPLVDELHERFALYFGVAKNQVISLSNATLALEGASKVICNELQWLSPSFTFSATNLALLNAGADFVFGDIDKNWRLENNQEFFNIMDVCPFGDSLNLSRFEDNKKFVIVDAAASFDSMRNCGEIIQSVRFPVGIVVSFHATKILPGAEGGLFISNSTAWVNEVKQWSTFGMRDSRLSDGVGTNAKMHEYSAALILASLDTWTTSRHKWLTNKEIALKLCEKIGLEVQPSMYKDHATSYWIIRSKPEIISRIESAFGKLQIGSRRWWEFGCHEMQAFRDVVKLPLENTHSIARETLGLPFHLNLSKSDFSLIERIITESLG